MEETQDENELVSSGQINPAQTNAANTDLNLEQKNKFKVLNENRSNDLNEMRLIEAALFISGRELTLEELRKLTGIAALGYLQQSIEKLQHEYAERGSAIEIIESNGKYGMKIRNEYVNQVKQFAQEMEVSRHALRVLAYISKHDGVLKSELVKRMGAQVYQSAQELVENEFIRPQKSGRSAKLFLTDKFKKYFSQQ